MITSVEVIVHCTSPTGEKNTWQSFLFPLNLADFILKKKQLRWTRNDGKHQGIITSYEHRYFDNMLTLNVTQEF